MVKKSRSGLLSRPRSITGKNNGVPKSLKPQKARSLIRRFHVLQRNRNSILTKLNVPDLNDQNYKQILPEKYNLEWKQYYISNLSRNVEKNKEIYKIDSSLQLKDLFTMLAKIDNEEVRLGGLKAYQTASIHGQDSSRGGDSSKKLVEWLKRRPITKYNTPMNALEIGCLNPSNQISKCGIFEFVTKIDLNSQSPDILQQNFMERPLPNDDQEKFNLISCSLVLNFVPTPKERGDMLKRITKFLKPPSDGIMSSLFFVLPLPCLDNSRYIEESLFEKMMLDLGFIKIFSHKSAKIIYYLFDWNGKSKKQKYAKKEIKSGKNRNNFNIVFD